MGRITNSVGLRLGTVVAWKTYGVVVQKAHCMLYYNYVTSIIKIIDTAILQDKAYLFSKANFVQEKNKCILSVYFYIRDVSLFSKRALQQYSKLLKRYKLKKKKKNS